MGVLADDRGVESDAHIIMVYQTGCCGHGTLPISARFL